MSQIPTEGAVQESSELQRLIQAGQDLITTETTARILQLKPNTLRKWACYEKGLILPVRVGRALRWRVADVAKLVGEKKKVAA